LRILPVLPPKNRAIKKQMKKKKKQPHGVGLTPISESWFFSGCLL
jgi:hypothetical protein